MNKFDNHIWGMGWEDSDTPHPGFGSLNIYGGYTTQCEKCGMYADEFMKDGKHENKPCSDKIRDF